MLLTCLEYGLHDSRIEGFYHIARSCLVKSETDFDTFDQVFARYFEGLEGGIDLPPELLEWLADPKPFEELSDEMRAALEHLDIDELMRRFQQTMAEQDERHDGGGRWVGTGGRSPFGHGGEHPTGIRVGGPGGKRMAMKVAEERHFQDYRTDVALDVPEHEARASSTAPADARRRSDRARHRRDDRQDLPRGGRDRADLPAQTPQRRPTAAAARRRRDDGSLLRAREPVALGALRGTRAARLQGVPFPQLCLRARLRIRATAARRVDDDGRSAAHLRRALEAHDRRRRGDASERADLRAREHRSSHGDQHDRSRLAEPAGAAFQPLGLAESRIGPIPGPRRARAARSRRSSRCTTSRWTASKRRSRDSSAPDRRPFVRSWPRARRGSSESRPTPTPTVLRPQIRERRRCASDTAAPAPAHRSPVLSVLSAFVGRIGTERRKTNESVSLNVF